MVVPIRQASRLRRAARRGAAVLLPAAIALGLTAGPVEAATPLVALKLSVSPGTSVDGAMVTYTGTITRVAGTPKNVRLHMEGNWYTNGGPPAGGACAPTPCHVDGATGNAYWTLASVSGTRTITFKTPANSGAPIRLYLDGGAGTVTSGVPTATVAGPRPGVTISYIADAYPVVTGSTLHVTVRGFTNAGPLDADLQATLGAGLGDPTNVVPATAAWSGSGRYIDDNVTLNRSAVLTFDTQVTAALGANVTLSALVIPVNSKYMPGAPAGATLGVHVGPQAPVRYEEANSRFHFDSHWTKASIRSASGGRTRYATRSGATCTFTFTGRSVRVVAPKGPTRGSASVYINGAKVGSFSLYAAAPHAQRTVFTWSATAVTARTLKIVVAGTRRHSRVDIDAVIVQG